MPEEELGVWLGRELVATLHRTRSGELGLRFREEALARYGDGAVVLSVALPLTARRRHGAPVTYWAESLLPEGETRTVLEQRFGVRRGDTFGLLAAIGADCAGAVSFLPLGAEPVETVAAALELDDDELDEAIRGLPDHPLGADEHVRVSLGGLQAKLLLTRTPSGRWARPSHGTPSTHIAKPDSLAFPGRVVAEAFTLALAAAAGIPASGYALTRWGDRDVLVLSRFDRVVDGERVVRLHQEDGCAALGVNPDGRHKYQSLSPDSPSLARLADVLGMHGTNRRTDLTALAAAVTVRTAVGDTDGHARNYGLLHAGHSVALAPLYDAAPTSAFVSTRQVGLWVGGQASLSALEAQHLSDEFRSWGIPAKLAQDLPRDVLERLVEAFPMAREAIPQLNDAVADQVHARMTRLLQA